VEYNFASAVNANLTLTADWREITTPSGSMLTDCENEAQTCLGTSWYSFNDNSNGGASTITPLSSMTAPLQ